MKKLFSLRKLQRVAVMVFLVPMLLLQMVQSLFSLKILSEEMAQNGQEIIYLHQNALDGDVEHIANSISNYWAMDYNHAKLLYPQTDFDAYLYSYGVMREYRSLMAVEPSIGALLLVSQANEMIRAVYDDDAISYHEKDHILAFVEDLISRWEEAGFTSWEPVRIGERFYLARLFRSRSAGTVCLVPLDRTIDTDLTANGALLYADSHGVLLTNDSIANNITLRPTEEDTYFVGKYFVTQHYSPVSGVYLALLESSPASFQKINTISLVILGCAVFVLSLVLVFFVLLKRWYLRPMEQMELALRKIRRGQMEVRFREDQKVEELQYLSTSFNQMMDHVKQMRIEAYEKELRYRYAQLQYLQLQISPHFFLNTLKSLYGMAQGKNYEKIQNAILMISDHVRYIFHDNRDVVTLATELHHVENYVAMQRYVTSRRIDFHLELDPDLENASIPPLCLQTFIENSCKYAIVPERDLSISLEIRKLPSEDGDRLDILIRDNGPRVSAELLKEFNGRVSFKYREEHIGILNVRQRFQLMFGKECGFACRNLDPGTEFELIFPVGFTKNEKETEEDRIESFGR